MRARMMTPINLPSRERDTQYCSLLPDLLPFEPVELGIGQNIGNMNGLFLDCYSSGRPNLVPLNGIASMILVVFGRAPIGAT